MIPSTSAAAWRRVLTGLGYARRGIWLVAASGLLLLCLGAAGRAGCANPSLPEVRSLMHYQSVVFYAALWLGFVMVIGGQLYTALLPGSRGTRAAALSVAGLGTVAFLVGAAQSSPGVVSTAGSPPAGVGQLAAAVLGTAALAASALPVMLVARQLGHARLVRSAALFGPALLVTAAANAEAASGLVFPDPVDGLYVVGVIGAINAAALWWLCHLVLKAERLIQEHLAT